MANKFQVKRTSVPGRVPNTTNSSNSSYIAAGEFALNMTDKLLYTSNGSTLITIGSTAGILTVTDSIRIGSVETDLLSINSTSVFTGNLQVNTTINTTAIAVVNSTGNSSLSPINIFVGNNVANVNIDITGGIKNVDIVSANVKASGAATLRTTIDHGITSITQSKVFVHSSNPSLNTENYSTDYAGGFNIVGIPTPNTIVFTLPTDSFKYKWGDRTIVSISRDYTGLVTVITKGPHLYNNLDQAYITNVTYRNSPFSILDGSKLPTPVTLTVVDSTTVTYTQPDFASTPVDLTGRVISLYKGPSDYTMGASSVNYPIYIQLTAPKTYFTKFIVGSNITFSNFPSYQSAGVERYASSYYIGTRFSPSFFNKTWKIAYISNNSETVQTIGMFVEKQDSRDYNRYINWSINDTSAHTSLTLPSGYITYNYVETGTVTNLSQLCPYLPTTSTDGYIEAINPVGVTIKNGSKLVYVFDSGVYVGNTSLGNIVDSSGSRTFKPNITG